MPLRKIHKKAIDWAIYDNVMKDRVTCYCGSSFNTHHETIWSNKHRRLMIITRELCPKCGYDDNIWYVSSQNEHQVTEGELG